MDRSLKIACVVALMAAGSGVSWAQPAPNGGAAEKPFLEENDKAMNKMMTDMQVKPTGDVDADFAAMMIPHHQGAIDMARAELKYGKNPTLRRLAQNIITDQQREIAVMRKAVRSAPAPAQPSMQMHMRLENGEAK
jgi:uncharacterized protein (DUF305 family)